PRGPLGVHVDPLVVIGGVGELVDPVLANGDPVGHAQLLADELVDGVQVVTGYRHVVPQTGWPRRGGGWSLLLAGQGVTHGAGGFFLGLVDVRRYSARFEGVPEFGAHECAGGESGDAVEVVLGQVL